MFQLFLICNRLVSEKTIEENILKKANEKRLLGSVAIEGGNFTTAFFRQVLREYLNLLNLRLISVQAWRCRLMRLARIMALKWWLLLFYLAQAICLLLGCCWFGDVKDIQPIECAIRLLYFGVTSFLECLKCQGIRQVEGIVSEFHNI